MTTTSNPSGRARGNVVTITDVAKHAGVAASTVSYVLSGKRTISATTRARVMASIRTLGFHPHAGARSLASNKANVIALALPLRPGMHLPILMQFAMAVLTGARSVEHDVLLLTADEGAAGVRRIAGSALVDGLILMDVETHDPRVPTLLELDRPSVLIGLPASADGLTCVDLDFAAAGAACVQHLAALGHQEIALLGAPQVVYDRDTGFARRTRDGVMEAARTAGLTAVARPCEPTYAAALEALRSVPHATGLIVHNEAAVDHVLTALRELDRRVPDDVSVVAICPDEIAERATPALTSVPIPASEVGRRAVELLMAKLDGVTVPNVTLLAPNLTVRSSTGPITH
ncbi:MAG: LacI family DNA-binding transcriptional regulator [Hamadaea sp.]|uniref:LacI family DNA-binding transcriptional regulator n=1 Tax=Hamadaea sp. TaxID=2024425 RepID=UPI0017A44C61|nr:LacI family DNA-binding transcriptional regulator [Hamadaea sp.]NUT22612.1 LacI family DNA-binding transcriptional regulator [Hamadaea sp.]